MHHPSKVSKFISQCYCASQTHTSFRISSSFSSKNLFYLQLQYNIRKWNQRGPSENITALKQHRHSPMNAKPIHSAGGGNCFTAHPSSQSWTRGALRCCCSGSASPSNPSPLNEEIQSCRHSLCQGKIFSIWKSKCTYSHFTRGG